MEDKKRRITLSDMEILTIRLALAEYLKAMQWDTRAQQLHKRLERLQIGAFDKKR